MSKELDKVLREVERLQVVVDSLSEKVETLEAENEQLRSQTVPTTSQEVQEALEICRILAQEVHGVNTNIRPLPMHAIVRWRVSLASIIVLLEKSYGQGSDRGLVEGEVA